MITPRTMFDKIWDRHVIHITDDGQTLLYIDRHLLTDGAFHGFNILKASGSTVRRPDQTFAVPDHYVPTRGRTNADFADDERRQLVATLDANTRTHGITQFGLGDERQGIVHIIGPEQGITQPGLTMVCGDSHTSTHGALGAFAFGVGASEVGHVLATQSLWQRKPKRMRVSVEGERGIGVTAKDLILAIIANIGADGGVAHVLEYAGSAIRGLSAEERMTVCNMSIEAGARAGMIAPDETTFEYLKDRPYAPSREAWDKAVAYWRTLPSDADATFDRELTLEAAEIAPMVTWGTSPEDAVPINELVPDPAGAIDDQKRMAMAKSLEYMGLEPGAALDGLSVDRVFIGSCTNSRIEDLRAAADIARDRRAAVPTMVVPGSGLIKAQAEAEGLDRVFRDAGFEWLEAGCSMCVGINGDTGRIGERVASTTNRNFVGRQGTGVRTHLMSPGMAALAAITGKLTDPRRKS